MKKFLLGMIAVSFCQLALAESKWTEFSAVGYVAKTPNEIADLLMEFSRDFEQQLAWVTARLSVGLPIDTIVRATYLKKTLRWTGATQCAPTDPRLTWTAGDTNVRYASGHGAGSMMSKPIEKDPCSF
jgi:hypothetical protein